MLFNSHEFISAFLPIVFAGFFLAARLSTRFATAWLCAASLAFYAWWSPIYVLLLLGSICVNYCIGREIGRRAAQERMLIARQLLFGGIAINVVVLGYFKYTGFFVQMLGSAVPPVVTIILPLGISFYTFTQIAYLVDAYRGKVAGYDPLHYALFVTYFPHLIAGPILHHNEMIPQFERPSTYRFSYENISAGMTIFFIGLFKKVILADGIAPPVGPIFDAAAAGVQLTFLEAWVGALCYSFQLYFDFSGYCDMAIGISRLFGIALPLNFHSPYKAENIIEFWRRWHMTLSRFLRDYLYIPLGGSRTTLRRRHVNVMVTMLLGGLWHGAGWTFILWGGPARPLCNHEPRLACVA
jgi:alginate O-acetyltransferase complex protein AlgI